MFKIKWIQSNKNVNDTFEKPFFPENVNWLRVVILTSLVGIAAVPAIFNTAKLSQFPRGELDGFECNMNTQTELHLVYVLIM